MSNVLPLHGDKDESAARPAARPVPQRKLTKRSSVNRSIMGNLHVLESFARNDGHQGSLDVEKLKAHEQELLRRKSSQKLGVASGNSRRSLLGSLRGAAVSALAGGGPGSSNNLENSHRGSWILQMNQVMAGGRESIEAPHARHKGSLTGNLNVVMNTSSGIARTTDSGKFRVIAGGGAAANTMNIKNLGEFESTELADRLFELYLFYQKDANEALSVWSVEFPPMMKMLNKYRWTRVMLETILDNQVLKDWRTKFSQTMNSFNAKHMGRSERSKSRELSGHSAKRNSVQGMMMEADGIQKMRDKTTNQQGSKYGSLLLRGCLLNGSVKAAVDEWILQNTPVRKMSEKFPFFRAFIEVLLYHVQGNSTSLKFRLALGVVFTYVDQITDFWVMVQYYQAGVDSPGDTGRLTTGDDSPGDTGNENLRTEFIAMALIFSFHLLQDIFWIVMLKRQNRDSMKRDIWLRIFFIKPVFDLYKIFLDYPPDHGCMIDPLQEFVDTKQVETMWECIPQAMIQGLALFNASSAGKRTPQIISLAITMLTTGFNQAVCSTITDIDPKKRQKDSETRGFVPNTAVGRTFTFLSLTAFITLYSSLRTGAYVILMRGLLKGLEGYEFVFVTIVLFQYALSIAIKYVTSGDFFCWWPVSGMFAFVLALFVRLQNFILTDFAPFTEHRLPSHSGGLFWTGSIVYSLVSNFAFISVSEFADIEWCEKSTCGSIDSDTLFEFYSLGTVVCLFFALCFFLSIKKSHWKTFLSMESSKQYYIRTCWDNEEDGTKVDSLLKHISLRPDAALVREWMEKNWLEWEEENPSWFHHYRKTLLYVLEPEYLPSPETLAKGESAMNARLIREEEEYWEEQRKLQADEDSDDDDPGKNKTWSKSVRDRLRRASDAVLNGGEGKTGTFVGTRSGTRSGNSSFRSGGGSGRRNSRRPSAMAAPPPRPIPNSKKRRATLAVSPASSPTRDSRTLATQLTADADTPLNPKPATSLGMKFDTMRSNKNRLVDLDL